MSSINYLVPGYTQQGVSYLQSHLYEGAAWVTEKQRILGAMSLPFVYLLDRALTYASFPIRLIEDVALTAINLVGALFKEECRGHLRECAAQLIVDVKLAIRTIVIVAPWLYPSLYPLIAPTLRIYVLTASTAASTTLLMLEGIDALFSIEDIAKEKASLRLIPFCRTQAIRVHGYAKVSEFEQLLELDDKKMQSSIPSDVLSFYKKLIEGGTTEERVGFLDTTLEEERTRELVKEKSNYLKYAWIAKKQDRSEKEEETTGANATKYSPEQLAYFGPPVENWVCPDELGNDFSNIAIAIKRILSLSEGIDPSTMNQEQVDNYLQSLLGLHAKQHEPGDLQRASQTLHLLLHAKINNGTAYEAYAKKAREALDAALEVSVMRGGSMAYLDHSRVAAAAQFHLKKEMPEEIKRDGVENKVIEQQVIIENDDVEDVA